MKALSYKIDIIMFIVFKIHEGQMSQVVHMLFDSDELDQKGLRKKKHSKPQSKTTRARDMYQGPKSLVLGYGHPTVKV